MPENEPPPVFELELGEHGNRLVFKTPEELRTWADQERAKWQWLNEAGRPMTDRIWENLEQFHNQLNNLWNEWIQNRTRQPEVQRVFGQLKTVIEQHYKGGPLLNSTSPAAEFIFELKAKRSASVAAGAYAGMVAGKFQTGGEARTELFDGLVEAFLFKREVDWTANAHQQAFNRLKTQYEAEMARQDARFKELEEKNRVLNVAFDAGLKEKSDTLQKLHGDQAAEFTKLIEQHVQKLDAIQKTYDKTLALQKPVKYWQTKEGYHRGRAKLFGAVASVSVLAAGGGLTWLAYWALAGLSPSENPKHWQMGVLLLGAFFAVWLVRIFVRMLFSHLHLATDAAERRMMILTYLSMSRQGTQFAAEDQKLIVQHIFRSASDGLVKDDAAPPSIFEMMTRK